MPPFARRTQHHERALLRTLHCCVCTADLRKVSGTSISVHSFSPTHTNERSAANTIDGITCFDFPNGARDVLWGNPKTNPGWIIFNFGITIALGQIVLWNQGQSVNCPRCIAGYDLYFTHTGSPSEWTKSLEARWSIDTIVEQQLTDHQCPNLGKRTNLVHTGEARYWKLDVPPSVRTGTDGTYYGFMEVEFYQRSDGEWLSLVTPAPCGCA